MLENGVKRIKNRIDYCRDGQLSVFFLYKKWHQLKVSILGAKVYILIYLCIVKEPGLYDTLKNDKVKLTYSYLQ